MHIMLREAHERYNYKSWVHRITYEKETTNVLEHTTIFLKPKLAHHRYHHGRASGRLHLLP